MRVNRLVYSFCLTVTAAALTVAVSSGFCGEMVLEEDVKSLIQKDWDQISNAEKTAVSGRMLTRAASTTGIYPNTETPLVTEDERDSIAESIPLECSAHFLGEAEKLTSNVYSRNGWLTHISKCKKCCRPYMTGIITKHVTKVANGPHTVVLFDFDKSEIKDPFKRKLRDLFNNYSLEGGERRVLFIGRASNIGDRERNMQLSQARTHAIEEFLTNEGHLKDGQSTYMLFGSQPPQLTRDIARIYRVDNADVENTSFVGADPDGTFRVNQSVVVAIYR